MKTTTMMKITILLTSLILTIGSSYGFEINTSQNRDKINQIEVTLTIKSDELEFINPEIIYYEFFSDKKYPVANQISLEDKNNFYSGIIPISDSSKYIIFKLLEEGEVYDNGKEYWDHIILDKKLIPKEDSYYFRALSYLNSNLEYYDRTPSFKNAKFSLDKELAYNPNNIKAKIAALSLFFDFKLIDFNSFNSQVRNILTEKININDENVVKSVVNALNIINESDKAKEILKKFVNQYPNSSLAEQESIKFISTAKNLNSYTDYSLKFLNSNSDFISNSQIYKLLIQSYLQARKLKEIPDLLSKLNFVPPFAYSQIAFDLFSDRNKYLKAISNQVIDSLISDYINKSKYSLSNLSTDKKPSYMSHYDFDLFKMNLAEELGILELATKINIAEENEIISIFNSIQDKNKISSDIYFAMIRRIDSSDLIDNLIKEAIKNDSYDSRILDLAFKYLEDSTLVEELLEEAYEKRESKILEKLINPIKITGSFKTLEDNIITMDSLQNKISVIMVFASWCGPCQVMVPAYNQLYNNYVNNPDIEVFALNIWEEGNPIESIVNNMDFKKIQYPILLDNEDNMVKELSVFGLPTTYIVNGDAEIIYREDGFTNEINFLEKIDTIILNIVTKGGEEVE